MPKWHVSIEMHQDPKFDEAIVHLVAEHQAPLRGFVAAMMLGSPDVDDVVQEVNQLAWRRRDEFELNTNFKAWILTMAKFTVMSAWRDQRRRKETLMPEELLVKLMDEGAEAPESKAIPRHEALQECLETLRPVDRALILKRYFDDYRVKQLADEVGRSSDSLKMSLHRIRNVLATCVKRRLSLRGETS